MKKFLFVASVLLITFGTLSSSAQNVNKDSTFKENKVVVLNNGTEYIGEIISDDGREVLLNTISVGKIYLMKRDIKEIKSLERKSDVKEGVYIGDDIFSTRYFISTNGFPVKKKDTYAMLNISGPEFQVAVSDHFSLGIMTTWAGAPFCATGKYSTRLSKDLYFGTGFIAGTSTWIGSFRYNGALGFTSLTYGNRNYNISLSAGGAYMNDSKPQWVQDGYTMNITGGSYYTPKMKLVDHTGEAFLGSVSGTARLGKKASYVMENFYYYDGKHTVFIMAPGFRFSNAPDRAFQFAVAGVFTETGSFPVPFATWFFKLN